MIGDAHVGRLAEVAAALPGHALLAQRQLQAALGIELQHLPQAIRNEFGPALCAQAHDPCILVLRCSAGALSCVLPMTGLTVQVLERERCSFVRSDCS